MSTKHRFITLLGLKMDVWIFIPCKMAAHFSSPPEDAISSVRHQMPTSSYSDLFYCTVLTCNGSWLANNCHVARLAAHFYNSCTQLSLDSQFIKVRHVACVAKRAGSPWHRGSINLVSVSFHLLIPLLDINHPVQHASQSGLCRALSPTGLF